MEEEAAGGDSAARPSLAVERQWLQAARDFACRALFGTGESQEAAWRCLRRALTGRGLPLAYSLISVSDLQTQQREPCCSHLPQSSDEGAHRREAVLDNQRTLPQTHLILLGYLRDEALEERDKLMDGRLYVRDKTGELPCELLHFKLEWLGCLLLFPSWAYIPQRGKCTAGYVEILADPVQVVSGPEKMAEIIPVFYPGLAAQLLSARAECQQQARLNVAGELSRLSPVLYIHRRTFFFLFLKCSDSPSCVPVLVQKTPQLVWHRALQLGHRYVLTALKRSGLKASGLRVLTTSSSSCLLPYRAEEVEEQFLDGFAEGSPAVSASSGSCMQPSSSLEVGERESWPAPVRRSKVISYVGTITQVLNGHAGLYEMDNKFTLCLAYQQLLSSGRGLRPGARVELRDVHLVQKPLASSPFVLASCLRSAVTLMSFSRCSTFHQPVASFGNLYVQLLLRYNLSLPLYLWLVSMLETFEQRFCCFIQHQPLLLCSGRQAQGAAERFIVPLLNALTLSEKPVRDVHREILAEEHRCPLEQCEMLEPPCQSPPFALLHTLLEKRCWESFSPSQQLSSASVHGVGARELNRRLAWSYCSLSADSFRPPLVLLGVLGFSSSGSLQLQDGSQAVPCVIFHSDGRPFADTSLIGCLLQVEPFQLVTERFLQSHFPSWPWLVALECVKEKQVRSYVQFCYEDVKILHSPGKRFPEGPTARTESSSAPKDSSPSVANLQVPEGGAGSGASTPERSQSGTGGAGGASRLFWVVQKEGLARRNYLQTSEGAPATQLCFQATVLWVGRAELCGSHLGDTADRLESDAVGGTTERQQRALLLFLGKSLRWFPLLHPHRLYRLVIPHCSDLDEFERLCCSQTLGSLSSVSSRSSFVPVPDAARLYHVSQTAPQLALAAPEREQELLSIAEILSPSFTGSLVSFSGMIVERTLCESRTGKRPPVDCSGPQRKGSLLPWNYTVKLNVSPVPGSSLALLVYVEATFLPYLWGLLPGAGILFQNLQRRTSRFNNIYCLYVASSFACPLTPAPHTSPACSPDAASGLSPTYLSHVLPQPPGLCQGQATCHVTCVLSLSLQWTCSLCSSPFTEGRCSQNNPPCLSRTGVPEARARILVEDGTSEFVVWCRNQQVRKVLHLSPNEWDVVQHQALKKGLIDFQHRGAGTGPGSTGRPDNLVTWYMSSLCRSPLVCRPILLAFRLDRKPSEVAGSGQPRRFFSHEFEFLSQISNRQNLMCLSIQEAT